jgi:hypothetical protein
VEASADVDGRPLEVALSVDGVAPLLAGRGAPGLGGAVLGGGQATFEGRLSLTPALDGDDRFRGDRSRPASCVAGAAMPALPRRRARPDRGERPDHPDGCRVGPPARGRITLDDNELVVALDMVPGEDRPMIRGTVSGGILTFMPIRWRGAAAGGADGRQTRPDGLPIPLMSLAFSPPTQRSRCALAGRTRRRAAGRDRGERHARPGAARFEIGRIDAYGGRLAGGSWSTVETGCRWGAI